MRFSILIIAVGFLVSCGGEAGNEADNVINDAPENNEVADEVVEEVPVVPMDVTINSVEGTDLPGSCDYAGNLSDCWSWEDNNGVNYLIRTVEEPVLEERYDDGTEVYGQTLHVYHYAGQSGTDDFGLLRDLTDFEKLCDFDLNATHIDAVELSDLDEDNVGEVIFGYRLACRSDVSPSTQKVVLYEGGDKYILRGYAVALGYGGDFEPGEAFDNAPEGFFKAAEDYWEANKVEFE